MNLEKILESNQNLYEWQTAALKQVWEKNGIISAPTGAGKTKVAYLWMKLPEAVKGKHKILYTVPLKALANEKYEELREIYGGDIVGVETGDIKENQDAPLVVCTQEIYTRKYTKRNTPAYVIIDELHYIFRDQGRSRAYIDGIRFSPETHKILIMSATFGDPVAVQTYLHRISNKRFELFQTDFKPTKLEFTKSTYTIENIPPHTLVYVFSISAINYLISAASTYRKALPLLKRRKLKKLANSYLVDLSKFPEVVRGMARYHSKLSYTEKKFIEAAVREGYVNTIFSTDALGTGVNLPIETILFGSTRIPCGFKETRHLTKTEFIQLSGRAGRKGYFDTGYVGVLLHEFTPYVEDSSDIRYNYERLLEKEIEPPVVKLQPNIEGIIKGEAGKEEELEYVTEFSNPTLTEEEIKSIKSELDELEYKLSLLEFSTKSILRKFYMPELNVQDNIILAKILENTQVEIKEVVNGKSRMKLFYKYVDVEQLPFTSRDEISTMLLKRKIGRNLNRKMYNDQVMIKIRGLGKLEDKIRKLDPLLEI